MKNLFILAILACILWACGQGGTSNEAPATQSAPTVTPGEANTLPGYPQEKVKLLFDSADYVDVIFYYEDFSINQKKQSDIRGMLNYISTNVPQTINNSCQPIGRIFFQVQGRNEAEADIFFKNECLYFLFYQDGKYAYANNFTQSGVNFFTNIFAQVNAQKKAAQQNSQQGQ